MFEKEKFISEFLVQHGYPEYRGLLHSLAVPDKPIEDSNGIRRRRSSMDSSLPSPTNSWMHTDECASKDNPRIRVDPVHSNHLILSAICKRLTPPSVEHADQAAARRVDKPGPEHEQEPEQEESDFGMASSSTKQTRRDSRFVPTKRSVLPPLSHDGRESQSGSYMQDRGEEISFEEWLRVVEDIIPRVIRPPRRGDPWSRRFPASVSRMASRCVPTYERIFWKKWRRNCIEELTFLTWMGATPGDRHVPSHWRSSLRYSLLQSWLDGVGANPMYWTLYTWIFAYSFLLTDRILAAEPKPGLFLCSSDKGDCDHVHITTPSNHRSRSSFFSFRSHRALFRRMKLDQFWSSTIQFQPQSSFFSGEIHLAEKLAQLFSKSEFLHESLRSHLDRSVISTLVSSTDSSENDKSFLRWSLSVKFLELVSFCIVQGNSIPNLTLSSHIHLPKHALEDLLAVLMVEIGLFIAEAGHSSSNAFVFSSYESDLQKSIFFHLRKIRLRLMDLFEFLSTSAWKNGGSPRRFPSRPVSGCPHVCHPHNLESLPELVDVWKGTLPVFLPISLSSLFKTALDSKYDADFEENLFVLSLCILQSASLKTLYLQSPYSRAVGGGFLPLDLSKIHEDYFHSSNSMDVRNCESLLSALFYSMSSSVADPNSDIASSFDYFGFNGECDDLQFCLDSIDEVFKSVYLSSFDLCPKFEPDRLARDVVQFFNSLVSAPLPDFDEVWKIFLQCIKPWIFESLRLECFRTSPMLVEHGRKVLGISSFSWSSGVWSSFGATHTAERIAHSIDLDARQEVSPASELGWFYPFEGCGNSIFDVEYLILACLFEFSMTNKEALELIFGFIGMDSAENVLAIGSLRDLFHRILRIWKSFVNGFDDISDSSSFVETIFDFFSVNLPVLVEQYIEEKVLANSVSAISRVRREVDSSVSCCSMYLRLWSADSRTRLMGFSSSRENKYVQVPSLQELWRTKLDCFFISSESDTLMSELIHFLRYSKRSHQWFRRLGGASRSILSCLHSKDIFKYIATFSRFGTHSADDRSHPCLEEPFWNDIQEILSLSSSPCEFQSDIPNKSTLGDSSYDFSENFDRQCSLYPFSSSWRSLVRYIRLSHQLKRNQKEMCSKNMIVEFFVSCSTCPLRFLSSQLPLYSYSQFRRSFSSRGICRSLSFAACQADVRKISMISSKEWRPSFRKLLQSFVEPESAAATCSLQLCSMLHPSLSLLQHVRGESLDFLSICRSAISSIIE